MTDAAPQPQKKKNKRKKKKTTAPAPTTDSTPPPAPTPAPPTPAPTPTDVQNGTAEKVVDICEVLPQKVGMTTFFNDVEVTMTHSGNPDPPTNGTAKKKKKKKNKSNQQNQQNPPPEKTEAPVEKESDKQFIKLHPDRIELVNHPEISVTLSEPAAPGKNKKQNSEVKAPKAAQQKAEAAAPEGSDKPKKKKKKKKKNKNTENIENTAPAAEPVPETADGYTAPTYVKLPASGDNFVLLVSHESFSAESNKSANNSSEKDSKSTQRVLIKSKDRIEDPNGLGSNGFPSHGSVSIIPITQEESVPSNSSTGSMSMESSLEKVKMALNSAESPEANEEPKLTKAQLKAERRALQEAQRAAKLAKGNEKNPAAKSAKTEQDGKVPGAKKDAVSKGDEKEVSDNKVLSPADKAKDPSKKEAAVTKQGSPDAPETTVNKNASKVATKEVLRKDQVFSHLPQRKDVFSQKMDAATLRFHPSILELGSRYNKGMLCGSNARCVAFLGAFQDVIQDFKTPANREFSKVLEAQLQKFLGFLNGCRPLSVSITNAVKFLKHQINHLPKDEAKAKEELRHAIYNFVKEEILLARKAICISASAKIADGDHILVFAYSSVVQAVLCEAHDQGKKFRVLVVDSRPKHEGLGMLRSLVAHGVRCSYISVNAVSYVLRKVTKVMIGAHALLSNGFVMSRLGCNQLALIAASYSLPVMVCCETYKFCERALTDSFVHNELGDPDELVRLGRNDSLAGWQSLPTLQIYNILYDVTPAELISFVITEKGILPCLSAPVVLRVKQAGL